MSQFPPYRLSVTDDLRTGNAVNANSTKKGIPLAGAEAQAVLVVSLGAPITADVDGICAAQAIGAAGNALINGALASGGVATLDGLGGRGVLIDSTDAGDTTQTVTIYGTDVHGAIVVETIAANGTTAVAGLKAFKTITRVAVSAALTGNLTVGTTDVLGLPYCPVVGGYLGAILNENTADAATYVAPSRVTATATTGDVRGTIDPAGAVNGTNIYKVRIAVQNGPTNAAAFGVTQYGVGVA
jgi:hypothetical protein